ncbi:MAG: DUF285 domain-containing protein [Ruminococcus sp.]|nr:DUF285 domain-containing protein [Ruminococcus sp.]
MMNKILRKTAAAVMALTIVGGTLPQYSGGFVIAKPAISAHAFDTSSFDTTWYDISAKTLHLKGDIENLYLSDNERHDGIILPKGVEKSDVEIIVAEKGTVFPENCEILFSGFTNLKKMDLSQADTINVKNMNHMFSDCNKLTDLDISSFDTSNVTDMHCMFRNCSSLTRVDLSSFDTSKTKEMYLMFGGCSSLEELDLSSFDTSKVTDMVGMFKECGSLEMIDLSSFNTSKVTDMDEMFEKCSSLEELDLSNFNTSNVTYMHNMFSGCRSLSGLDLSNFNTSRVRTMDGMFEKCSSLEELDLSSFNTSNVRDMSSMFEYCPLTKLDISSFDTSNVEDMEYMFNCCEYLGELDLRNFNTSSVSDMERMFYYCASLTKLDLSSFDTSKVTDMKYMFNTCKNLKAIYVSDKFVTNAVTDSNDMFYNCSKLVGGNGTKFDSNKTGLEYARIDKPEQPGYFTDARVLDEKAVSRAKGASITLDGKIGVNLYVTLSDDVDHAILSGPNGDITLDAYELSKLKYSSDDFTGYKLSYYVDSTQSDKKITLKFFDADNNQLDIANADNTFDADNTIEYTVNTYIKNYKYGNNDEKLDDLVYSLSNYCKAADNFFSGKTNNITGISNVTASSFNNYKIVKTEGLNAKMSLVLNSEVSIRINYAGEETEAILIDGDKETTLTKENGYFIISNISADKLANTYTLKIGSNEIKFSALSYGYAVMNGGSNDAKLQTLVKALYKYAETAKAYKA